MPRPKRASETCFKLCSKTAGGVELWATRAMFSKATTITAGERTAKRPPVAPLKTTKPGIAQANMKKGAVAAAVLELEK